MLQKLKIDKHIHMLEALVGRSPAVVHRSPTWIFHFLAKNLLKLYDPLKTGKYLINHTMSMTKWMMYKACQ